MPVLAILLGILLIIVVAKDSFETIVLPRRVSYKFRLTYFFYRVTWKFWGTIGRRMHASNRREQYLGFYGPLSLILLLIVWAVIFIVAFALIHWGLRSPLNAPEKVPTFGSYLYMSGTTFFTLGLGDIAPLTGLSRMLMVIEAGIGFGSLALVIGYVPVIYQAFSRRELHISLLDARAGSPPSAVELILRHRNQPEELARFLNEWEHWCAELLESHLSYPVLAYYRSLHENQSWLGALTSILDACALLLVGIEGLPVKPAKFTFAIARHAAVDLAQSFGVSPNLHAKRLSSLEFRQLQQVLARDGLMFKDPATAEERLAHIRGKYELFVASLAQHMLLSLPAWLAPENPIDDWQTSAWDHFLDTSPRTLDETMLA
ncbi:two pore domain potassium channel family protein [Ktedonosporobacter rubrisoli]|uniref:Two pore domain potassium channel family protein n=1 Tax=Ktedonosporobacter rubrisoli TaxID=2509675 RepID=A0A4P6K415_KTERU|nr:potassium channel family protein [Ktedonosporobacter rubrisoli]QBD83027.1 two pore domain potassium channel family protein [Ktedonosporobacter rubrisoli]